MTHMQDLTHVPPGSERHAQAAKKAGHVPTEVRELGYGRQVCAVCRSDWPCADMAQAREDDDEAAVHRPDFEILTDRIGHQVALLNEALGYTPSLTNDLRERPAVTFGYLGNLDPTAHPGGNGDDRAYFVFLPHPRRIGTPEDRVGGFAYGDVDGARSCLSAVAGMVTLARHLQTAAATSTPTDGLNRPAKTATITVGWTRPDPSTGYSNFDGYRPGADQHTETIHVELPAADLGSVSRVAEAAFEATNAPSPREGTAAHAIAHAIELTGYRGEGAHYSLSVGDTVTYDGTTVACAPSGWQLIDHAAIAEAAGFDTTSSTSRQHFIDTSEYLRRDQAEEA